MSRRTQLCGKIVSYIERYNHYYDFLCGLAVSVHKWENVPDGMNVMFMERTLLHNGSCLVFEDDVLVQLLCMKYTFQGTLNIYDEPTSRHAYANNGYNRLLKESNSIIIWDNNLRTSLTDNIAIFASRLANLEMTIDININTQRTPYILECSKNEKYSLATALKQVINGEPAVRLFKGSDSSKLTDKLNVLKLDAPYLADKLELELERIWNTALTYIGIPNVRVEKSQYMSSDEVNRRMGGALLASANRLMPREIACKEINRMFGTELKVTQSIGGEDEIECQHIQQNLDI